MLIKKLSVKNFRIHKEYSIDVSNTTTVITGRNGAGKTSLLEAVYIALQGSSFRGSDSDIIPEGGSSWWRIELILDDGSERVISFDSSKQSGRKKITIDSKVSYRLSQKDKYPVVLFEPDDLRLLSGSPSRRRIFIDRLIAQIDPIYSGYLRRYERALQQRNNLLKRRKFSKEELFVWNVALSEYGSYIVSKRQQVFDDMNNKITNIYRGISGTNDTIKIEYSEKSHTTAQKLLSQLELSIEKDTALGYTSTGPHRHDVLFHLNNLPASSSASRGETRTILLSLKMLELETIELVTGKRPILLLDDVFSELDEVRQQKLIDSRNKNQIIITSVDFKDKNSRLTEVKVT